MGEMKRAIAREREAGTEQMQEQTRMKSTVVIAAAIIAAVRLGAISPTQAQAVLARLAPVLTSATEHALSLDLHELHSTAPELELYSLTHRRVNPRLFST